MDTKTCTRCKQTKHVDQFGNNVSAPDGLSRWCKSCSRAYYIKVRKTRKAHSQEIHRKSKLKQHYKITPEQYDAMLKAQGYKCAICRRHQNDILKRFAVDHDHETGAVRGLLCFNCNHGLADFKDVVQSLNNAINYLRGVTNE